VVLAHLEVDDPMQNSLGATLRVLDSNVLLYDTSIPGATGGDSVFIEAVDGSDGVHVTDARLFAAACEVRGGDGGSAAPGAFGCVQGGDGGDGFVVNGPTSRLELQASTVTAGIGGLTNMPPCTDGVDGTPIVVNSGALVNVPGTPAGLDIQSPVRGGQPVSYTLQAAPGAFAWLVFSRRQATGLLLNAFDGALAVEPPLIVVQLGFVPGDGTLTEADRPLTFAPFAGIEGIVLVAQGFTFAAGQGLVAGSVSSLLVLDPAL
jgi:hypothetical protein